MSLKKQLDYLFNPRSVAVIGASNQLGKWGYIILARLQASKSRRPIYAVNNREPEVLGMKAYQKVTDVPGPVDLAVITVPFQAVVDVMHDCVRKGVKVAIIITSGLAEIGGDGVRLEKEVVEIARKGGMRLVGPNCLGHIDTHTNVRTVGFLPGMRKGNVALISQSGNSSQSVTNYGGQMGIGFSKFVSTGNEADLHFEDFLEYLADDDETKVILGYIEGIRDGRRFYELAKEVTRKKPVVVMKAGRTDVGVRAAHSHTASLAGSDLVLDAAFRQCGVIRVDELSELVDVAVALLGQPLPRGRRVAVLTVGGGLGVIAADSLRKCGLEVPPLSSATMEKLNSILSGRWSRGNPVDTSGDISFPCLMPLLEDENIDAIMIAGPVWAPVGLSALISTPPWERDHLSDIEQLLRGVEEESIRNLDTVKAWMGQYHKPVVFSAWATGEVKDSELYRKLQHDRLLPYPTPDRAARALARLVEYSEYLGIAGGNT